MVDRTEAVKRLNLLSKLQLDRFMRVATIEAQIHQLQAQASEICADIDVEIAEVEKEVRADCLSLGETVKGADLWAVYTNGRVTWDNKALEGYAAAHPEIREFQKVGAPYVQVRKAQA